MDTYTHSKMLTESLVSSNVARWTIPHEGFPHGNIIYESGIFQLATFDFLRLIILKYNVRPPNGTSWFAAPSN